MLRRPQTVRASIERGDGDLEQIGATVRELLTQAWYAADCPPLGRHELLDLLTETEV